MSDIIAFTHKYKLDYFKLENISVLDIQNICLFLISVSSLFSFLYYYLTSSSTPFQILKQIISIHVFTDLYVTKSTDVIIHHLLVLGFTFYNYFCNVSNVDSTILLYTLIKTELSSIFYILKYWLPEESFFYNINLLLFYTSFFKFRILDYYYEIIYNDFLKILFAKYSPNNYLLISIMLTSTYGLYILNLYWFFIMNKMLYKKITKIVNINTDVMCHFLCSYIHWVNVPLSYYIYMYNPNEKYIFDMIGITCLSISSFKYHYDIYERLYDKQIENYELPNKDNIILFINDSLSIQLRSFLVIVTSYYYSQHLLLALFISGMSHVVSIYHSIINILQLFIDYDNNKDTFLSFHNIILTIPIAGDVFLIILNSPIEIAIPLLLVNIAIALLFVTEPFYKLTHFAFHLGLIAQNKYICLSNRSTF